MGDTITTTVLKTAAQRILNSQDKTIAWLKDKRKKGLKSVKFGIDEATIRSAVNSAASERNRRVRDEGNRQEQFIIGAVLKI